MPPRGAARWRARAPHHTNPLLLLRRRRRRAQQQLQLGARSVDILKSRTRILTSLAASAGCPIAMRQETASSSVWQPPPPLTEVLCRLVIRAHGARALQSETAMAPSVGLGLKHSVSRVLVADTPISRGVVQCSCQPEPRRQRHGCRRHGARGTSGCWRSLRWRTWWGGWWRAWRGCRKRRRRRRCVGRRLGAWAVNSARLQRAMRRQLKWSSGWCSQWWSRRAQHVESLGGAAGLPRAALLPSHPESAVEPRRGERSNSETSERALTSPETPGQALTERERRSSRLGRLGSGGPGLLLERDSAS